MSRARKRRRVRFIPNIKYFMPDQTPLDKMTENILKIEELEAVRLRDEEGLDQETCALRMNISRQTYQRILWNARRKIADSLLNGKAIRIEGGSFDFHAGRVGCVDCGHLWEESFDNFRKIGQGEFPCPSCGSHNIICRDKRGYKYCRSRRCIGACQGGKD